MPAPWKCRDSVELTALRAVAGGRDRVVVAFSGGVDSGLLAWVAHDVLGTGAGRWR